MKTAFIMHGTGGNNGDHWIPWLKHNLTENGFNVFTPFCKESNNLNKWEEEYLNHPEKRDDYDLIVAHSGGCVFMLHMLSKSKIKAKKLIMVAGFIDPLPTVSIDSPLFPKNLDDKAIAANANELFFIASDNDPYGCNDIQAEKMRKKFGGTSIIRSGEGHFGTNEFNETYTEFPLLLDLCLLNDVYVIKT